MRESVLVYEESWDNTSFEVDLISIPRIGEKIWSDQDGWIVEVLDVVHEFRFDVKYHSDQPDKPCSYVEGVNVRLLTKSCDSDFDRE